MSNTPMSILSKSESVLYNFVKPDEKTEFEWANRIFWNRLTLEYIQQNKVDAAHLLEVYRIHLTALKKCIELLEFNTSTEG